MIGIEVQRDDGVWLLDDRDAVLRMARIGQVGPVDEVREAREDPWALANSLSWLAAAFEGDPWDAWDELDGEDAEGLWAACAVPVVPEEEPAEDTDLTTRQAMEQAGPPAPEPAEPATEEVPAPTMSVSFKPAAAPKAPATRSASKSSASPPRKRVPDPPQPPPALRAGPDDPSMGQVIEFPQGRGGTSAALGSELPAALLQPLEVRDLVPNDTDVVRVHRAPPPAPPRSFAPWLVVMALILCLAAFGLSIWSIQLNAGWTSPRPSTGQEATPAVASASAPEAEPLAATEPPAQAPVVPDDAALVTTLDALYAELREGIPTTTVDLKGDPDELASALLIELSNSRLGPVRVSAPVLSWTGARNDVIEVAEVEVRLTSSGNTQRELGTVGLVVGKYLHNYGFALRSFTVFLTGEDGVTRKRMIEPDAARNLWSGRKDLYSFLAGK